MKFIDQLIMFFALVFLSMCLVLCAEAYNLPEGINSPRTLSRWMINSLTYQADKVGVDYWKTPEETLIEKGGDCEDFAILAMTILKDLGYEAHLVILFPREGDSGHAVCVFKYKGKDRYGVIDNQYLLDYWLYNTPADIFKLYSKEYSQALYTTFEKKVYYVYEIPVRGGK